MVNDGTASFCWANDGGCADVICDVAGDGAAGVRTCLEVAILETEVFVTGSAAGTTVTSFGVERLLITVRKNCHHFCNKIVNF